MKPSKKYKKIAFDGFTFGQVANHIGKRMTTKTHKSKVKYSRKVKHRSFE